MSKIIWSQAPDIHKLTEDLLKRTNNPHIKLDGLHFIRSTGTHNRAIARIWSLPTVWQQTLNVKPQYIIEVIGERFDKLNENKKLEVIAHELAHIPKTFSGALFPHKRRGPNKFHDRIKEIMKLI